MKKLSRNIWGRAASLNKHDQQELLNKDLSYGKATEIIRKVDPVHGFSGKVSVYEVQVIKTAQEEFLTTIEATSEKHARALVSEKIGSTSEFEFSNPNEETTVEMISKKEGE